jgi:hypothetical protein
MIRPLLRPRLSIRRASVIAERCDFVRQIYGLTATRLAEPVRYGAEEDQNTRRAVDWFIRRPGVRGPVHPRLAKIVDRAARRRDAAHTVPSLRTDARLSWAPS